MSQTFTVPQSLADEIDALKLDLGFEDTASAITYLLKNAVAQEKKLLVVRLYQGRQKTLRQCAELLNVDINEMIDILGEFGVPFMHDDLPQQLAAVRKLARKA